MRCLCLAVFALAMFGALPAAAQQELEIHLVELTVETEIVQVLVEGRGCRLVLGLPEVVGRRVLIKARRLPPGAPCDPPERRWVEPVGIPPLAPGRYTVELQVDGTRVARRPLRVNQALSVLYLDPEPAGGEESLYEVFLQWELPDGTLQTGLTKMISASAGYFWLFSPTSPEVMVKMVDGSAINGKDWLIITSAGALPFTVRVSHCNLFDPPQCKIRDYRYAGGHRAPIVDLTLE